MARAQFNVLVFPYRFTNHDSIEYCIFKRQPTQYGEFWQGIAGGGEDNETHLQAAKRESFEEAAIPPDAEIIQLDSQNTIPAEAFHFYWGPDVLMIPEYCFGVHLPQGEIKISDEHQEYRWVDYETARQMVKFDSNRNALWELNLRLTRARKE